MTLTLEEKMVKIFVIGPYESGKSTVVRALTSGKSVSVDELDTTIAFDYGYTFINMREVHVFGAPGHDRFGFLREILSNGACGFILVVDSTAPETFSKALEILKQVNPGLEKPFVIVANKQDKPGALSPEHVAEEFKLIGLEKDAPIIPAVATSERGVKEALNKLLELIEKSWG